MKIQYRPVLYGAALSLLSSAASAQSIAPGDTVHLRLLDRLESHHRHWPAAIHATVIAPVVRDGRVVIPPGSTLSGWVIAAGKENFRGKRHWLDVRFDSVVVSSGLAGGDSMRAPLALSIVAVDDARESVDSAGRVVGPPIPSLFRSKRGLAVLALGIIEPEIALVGAATFEGALIERHKAVALDSGVEMTAIVARGATLDAWPRWTPPPPIAGGVNLDGIASSAPMRAYLREGGRPSDIVSLAVIGSEKQVSAAFAAAGWTRAQPHNFNNDFKTFEKAITGRGYDAQPVSQLVLDGRPPDVVYEKVADTFKKRHHFRIWRWPATETGDSSSTVWLIAATHDTGLMFSMQRRAFTHRVDPHIDAERDKVVSDLVAADVVAAMAYVPRVAPAGGATVNGGRLQAITDWRMAVLVLR